MACSQWAETESIKNGDDRRGAWACRCYSCRRTLTALTATLCSGVHFPPDVIALAVPW
jgi:hypothetical protein